MKTRISCLLMIGLLGGIGGLVNASLCYWNITVADYSSFDLGIIPCGFLHGFLLAFIPIGVALVLMKSGLWIRLMVSPWVGWIAGWLSWGTIMGDVGTHPIVISKNQDPSLIERLSDGLKYAIVWPFDSSQGVLATLLCPLAYFGFVGLLLFCALSFSPLIRKNNLWVIVIVTVLSAILGSLWYWIEFKNWTISPIHGTIWGALVGIGLWKFNPFKT